MSIVLNPDKQFVSNMFNRLERNDGYCPRSLAKVPDISVCAGSFVRWMKAAVIAGFILRTRNKEVNMRVGRFEKVSSEQFSEAMKDIMLFVAGWELYNEYIYNLYKRIMLPTRATSGSAGYDFKSPFGFALAPGKTLKVPTGIRARIDEGWWLSCLPRSGLGFKYRLHLGNTMGVILPFG